MICQYCHCEFDNNMFTGRIPDYCCSAHRQAAYRLRKNGGERQRVSRQLRELMFSDVPGFRNGKNGFVLVSAGAGVLAPDGSPNGYKQSSLFAD
ncbi:hypothetical protein [Methylomonas sp. DH-1]|uniref:hypothetical protein n=1 Tax=Methylomonas sp. (strain DH-1) TaxID=1727196 RepID=UPI0012F64D82|nr:hypothetical protein [Methylomonas sp. DH-1]